MRSMTAEIDRSRAAFLHILRITGCWSLKEALELIDVRILDHLLCGFRCVTADDGEP
jgi:hypothetical protein